MPRNRPSPDVWGARLVTARRTLRERHAPPIEAFQQQVRAESSPLRPWEDAGALVRPYVVALGATPRNARTGAQASPWGNAR